MEEVELKLVADNKNAVKGIRELASESKNLWDNQAKQQKRQVGLIADIEKELGRLKDAQRNAMTVDHIEKYNKKIAEAKQSLKEYEEAGVKAEKSTGSLSKTIGKWALGLGGAAAALNILKEAVLATTTGLNAFNIVGVATKQVLYNLVTGAQSLTTGLTQVIQAQRELNALRVQDKIDTYNAKIELLKYNKALIEAKDQTKSVTERIKSYDEGIAHKSKATQIEIKSTEDQIKAYEKILAASPDNENAMMKYIDLQTQIIDLRIRESASMKEISSMRSGLIKKEWNDKLALWHDEIEEQNKFNKETWDAEDEFASKSKSLDDKRRKEREKAGVDEMARLKKEYDDKQKLAEDAVERTWKFDGEIAKIQHDQQKKDAKKEYDDRIANDELLIEANRKVFDARVTAYEEAGNAVLDYISIINELAQREVENAQRTTDLFNNRIAETQNALEAEIELYKAGYASNVAAKQQELDALKKQRDASLAEEEKARKKEHALKVAALLAQKAIDIAKVISATAVAKAEAYALMGNPITLAAGLALLTAAKISQAINIAAITASVIAASMSRFAKGGWTGDGSHRDETGERIAGVVHEKEFVVKRGPAHRYRDVLEAINKDDRRMVFHSLNKLSGNTNNILVQNDGPNKRLDEVNSQLRRLNNKEEVITLNDMTIYKRGDNVRIIKKR